jgi:hypothetical protein
LNFKEQFIYLGLSLRGVRRTTKQSVFQEVEGLLRPYGLAMTNYFHLLSVGLLTNRDLLFFVGQPFRVAFFSKAKALPYENNQTL